MTAACIAVARFNANKMISRPHLLTGAGVGEYKIYLPGLDLIPCLPNPSYCETPATSFASKRV